MKKKIILLGLMLVACDKPRSDSSATTTTTSASAGAGAAPTVNQVVTAADPAVTTAPIVTSLPPAVANGGWPLPDYPGAKVTKKTADYVSLETKDAPDKVVAFYKDKLKAAGFPPPAAASLAAGSAKDQPTVMTAAKGSQMLQVTVTPVQGTTKITLSSM